ncbi:MAG TPA: DUF1566 domain-containing protein [bacterium]|nr:DUF1566 domain-containing protein [bacterium]
MYGVARILFLLFLLFLSITPLAGQSGIPFRLPDTGQTGSYTATPGEDVDITLNAPAYRDNQDGTITDVITGLMWQQTDGGEMTFEDATAYCDSMTLGGYSDWRLPTSRELFSINNYDHLNPALDIAFFVKTAAEYWWSSDIRIDDSTRIWVVNAGGGIGPHPKSETKSASGTKLFHIRAVRNPKAVIYPAIHFVDKGDGTIYDQNTGLTWQKLQPVDAMTWEEALIYSRTITLAGQTDWRLPNIKELQSLNDPARCKPSVDTHSFPGMLTSTYWSSTTQQNAAGRAWVLQTEYGIVTYFDKSMKENLLLVRGSADSTGSEPEIVDMQEAVIPGGTFVMGDHFAFVDPSHPSDETPLHTVKVNAFAMAKFETSNRFYAAFLNRALAADEIQIRDNTVYKAGSDEILCYTHEYASWYSLSFQGSTFTIANLRADHPMVGVRWAGAAAFCNWLSRENGLEECYEEGTWRCDFSRNGYRLPTEAEWEFAGRGGHLNPYTIYPNGDTIERNQVNLPDSGDPYESGEYPHTTPVGFYDGSLKQKSDYLWPGPAANYQTVDGANGFGLYDMQGNVWELVNDWYGQNYYSLSPQDNPQGPGSGFIMPDGKPYHGMRGGNWYNGLVINGINDGHSRVANRNPSYYRGPQDPNHPWYHVGFRVARSISQGETRVSATEIQNPAGLCLLPNYPNPFNATTIISFRLPKAGAVTLEIYNIRGEKSATLEEGWLDAGTHAVAWTTGALASGLYFCRLEQERQVAVSRLVVIK